MAQERIGLFACGTAVLALSACSIDVNAEKLVRREDRTFAVTGTPDLVLKTFDGAISIQSWDKPEVLVTIERHAGDEESLKSIEVKAEQQGNQITVEVLRPERPEGIHLGIHLGRSASLIVTVPRQANVTAGSGDGAVSIEQVAGRLQLNTGDGAVTARGTSGDLLVHTGDGGVSLDGVSGQVELTTGDGGVSVQGALQRVQARTGDGGISVRAASGSAAAADWQLESGDGAVTLDLPAGFGAELDARSSDGRVTVDGFELAGATGRRDSQEARGRIGAGGHRLVIRTGDGSITVRKG
jgi:DUF4097 and DUF4098 domain-containing protein YvlB